MLLGLSLCLGYSENDKKNGKGGFMLYWHGILIQAYLRYFIKNHLLFTNIFTRLGVMLHNTDAGNGVIGIVECNNLEPLNNKQAFNMATPAYKNTEKWLEKYVKIFVCNVLI